MHMDTRDAKLELESIASLAPDIGILRENQTLLAND